MKLRRMKFLVVVSAILALVMSSVAGAQISYEKSTFTSYQVVNLGENDTTVTASYYDNTGTVVRSVDLPVGGDGGVATVLLALDNELGAGQFSATLSASEPLAAVVNQQLGDGGSNVSTAPFSSYTAVTGGATSVTVPVIMHNWFGYHTQLYIQNVSGSDTANVTITYRPTTFDGCLAGSTGQSETVPGGLNSLASKSVSQLNNTGLGLSGAPSGCEGFNGRFLGSAEVTSDVEIAVVANQYVQDKLFTYNGFTSVEAGTDLILPAYLRNWFNYYASLTIANPGAAPANVTVNYNPDPNDPFVTPSAPISANHTIPAGESITIYDGPTGGSDISSAYPYGTNSRFFGSVGVTSNVPVVAMINQEATGASGNQAGTYNSMTASSGSQTISVPLIQSDFYGYYTSLTIASVDGTNPQVRITYTSDSEFSSNQGFTKSYVHTLSSGFLNRYEGAGVEAARSDILSDAAWESGGTRRFIGSALIEVVSGSDVVAFVNSESNTAPNAATRDSMYTFNAFNLD
ncbi:MAG: hypothetical protein WDZ49_03430 [Litorilinea sp.]